jgi:hypothetical protein
VLNEDDDVDDDDGCKDSRAGGRVKERKTPVAETHLLV